ncbi:MAG: DUF374 domain-containing protein [Myxococcota bacterium]|nr:DUF374 domain-containing protein [Myxococcota bacterium]
MRRLLLWFASRTLVLLGATRRTRRRGGRRVQKLRAAGQPCVYALLHGRALLMVPELRQDGCTALVSLSRDGDLAAGLLDALGYGVVRGSSSRGAVGGLRGLCRSIGQGRIPAVTVDGPRGPAGRVAPGVVGVGRAAGAWIIPLAASCSLGVRLSSWDRTLLPVPGSRNLLLFGRPLKPGLAPETEQLRSELEKRLGSLQQQADRLTGLAE